MIYVLVWAVVTIGPQGPVGGDIPETTKFQSEAACNEFGRDMTPRLQDWVRGRLTADWDHPVRVDFRCAPDGKPA